VRSFGAEFCYSAPNSDRPCSSTVNNESFTPKGKFCPENKTLPHDDGLSQARSAHVPELIVTKLKQRSTTPGIPSRPIHSTPPINRRKRSSFFSF
jgi:hypothetical protein